MYQNFKVAEVVFVWNLYCLELNRLVRKLDKRRKKARKGFRSKPRQPSMPSVLQPSLEYPDWAVTLPTADTAAAS